MGGTKPAAAHQWFAMREKATVTGAHRCGVVLSVQGPRKDDGAVLVQPGATAQVTGKQLSRAAFHAQHTIAASINCFDAWVAGTDSGRRCERFRDKRAYRCDGVPVTLGSTGCSDNRDCTRVFLPAPACTTTTIRFCVNGSTAYALQQRTLALTGRVVHQAPHHRLGRKTEFQQRTWFPFYVARTWWTQRCSTFNTFSPVQYTDRQTGRHATPSAEAGQWATQTLRADATDATGAAPTPASPP